MKSVNSNLPPGIGGGIDIVMLHKQHYLLQGGLKVHYSAWPKSFKDLLLQQIAMDPDAKAALADLKLTDPDDQIKQYVYCNYGGYDGYADYKNGEFTREYWECGNRGKCRYEGKLCKAVQCKHGSLTPREVEVLKGIASGLLDKEVADKLNISKNTVHNHRASIGEKTGRYRRSELTAFAIHKNIVK